MKDNPQELFTHVDENDNVIGSILRKDAHTNPAIIHRAVGVLVFNEKDELLIQKRNMKKDLFPGAWDKSVGGHVEYGNGYLETAVRECKEELGLELKPEDLHELGKLHIKESVEQHMYMIYSVTISSSTPLRFAEDETEEIRFVSKETLKEMLVHEKWSDGCRLLFEKFIFTS